MSENKKFLYEVLVPTVKPNSDGLKFFSLRYHRLWDEKVRAIAGGLTIMAVARGQWVNNVDGEIFLERMIPVRIMCTEEQIDKVADLVASWYSQTAVMFYLISTQCVIKLYKDK